MADKLETISTDDVVTVSSVEGVDFDEIRLTIDTGDEQTTTTLSARQAAKLAETLAAHARGERRARHTTSCYVQAVNNIVGDHFWVCGGGCPTRRA